MRMTKTKLLSSALAALLVMSLTVQAANAAGADSGKPLVVVQGVDAETLDPAMAVTIANMNYSYNLYDTLVNRNSKLELIPGLAEEWRALDNLTWEFKLRKGVKFHNGEDFKADVVIFSWKRIYAEGSKSPQKGWFSSIQDVQALDDYTVRIKTGEPDPMMPARMTMLFMVPPKYVQEIGNTQFNLKPIGTGPFKFSKWVKNDRVEFEANTAYWNGAPGISNVIMKVMPETQAKVSALRAGEADIIVNVPPDQIPVIKSSAGCTLKDTPSTRVLWVQFVVNRESSPFKNKKVRQALSYGVNVPEIIEYVVQGYGNQIATILSPLIFGYDASITPYEYNPEKAKQLLAEAGYPNGLTVKFDSPNGRYTLDREVAQALSGQLAKIGVKANLQLQEWATYATMFSSHKIADMWLLGWSLPMLDPDAWMWPLFHSGDPLANWGNAEFDRVIEAARIEMDPAKRAELYSTAQKILKEEAPMIFLYQLKDLYGVSKRIDWNPRPDEFIRFNEVKWATGG